MNEIALNEEYRYLVNKKKELKNELHWCEIRMRYLVKLLTKPAPPKNEYGGHDGN